MTLPFESVRHLSPVSLRMRCQEEPSGTSVAIFTSTGCAPTGAAETIIAASATKATRTVPRRPVFIEPIGPPSPHSTNSSSTRPSSQRARF